MLLLSIVFLLLNTPNHSVRAYVFIRELIDKDYQVSSAVYTAVDLTLHLLNINFAANFALYNASGSTFRRAMMRLVHQLVAHVRTACRCPPYCRRSAASSGGVDGGNGIEGNSEYCGGKTGALALLCRRQATNGGLECRPGPQVGGSADLNESAIRRCCCKKRRRTALNKLGVVGDCLAYRSAKSNSRRRQQQQQQQLIGLQERQTAATTVSGVRLHQVVAMTKHTTINVVL